MYHSRAEAWAGPTALEVCEVVDQKGGGMAKRRERDSELMRYSIYGWEWVRSIVLGVID